MVWFDLETLLCGHYICGYLYVATPQKRFPSHDKLHGRSHSNSQAANISRLPAFEVTVLSDFFESAESARGRSCYLAPERLQDEPQEASFCVASVLAYIYILINVQFFVSYLCPRWIWGGYDCRP